MPNHKKVSGDIDHVEQVKTTFYENGTPAPFLCQKNKIKHKHFNQYSVKM